MNIQLATEVVKSLAQAGVHDFVVCAGARNAPFVKILGSAHGVSTHHFFDERAAGFFALGRARRDRCPVAVITTSGTAAAELLPSAIESYYSGVPLVFVTADRPKNYRGSAAPQAIEQVGIFSHYSAKNFDVDQLGQVKDIELNGTGPTHLNICFNEPLIDSPVPELNLTVRDFAGAHSIANSNELKIRDFFKMAKRPLVIVGGLSDSARSGVYEFLVKFGAPIYAEAQSGLRESEGLKSLLLQSGASLLKTKVFRENFDMVLRIGSVPTLRFWRDLEDHLIDVPVLSISELPFSGLARDKSSSVGLSEFLLSTRDLAAVVNQKILGQDQTLTGHLSVELQKQNASEPGFFRWLSEVIPAQSMVMLGNSLPIREWDLAATFKNKKLSIQANRGANGIDGLIATFLGLAKTANENWLILGDLSALYDLNALAFTGFAESKKLRVVVVNNAGGQIFDRMFHDKNFINSHQFEFSKWAEMFGWNYQLVTTPQTLVLADRPTVLEIRPDNAQTEIFWHQYEGLFQ